jgi:hypothetical protein
VPLIAGIRVTDSDAWWLVDRLRQAGRADDATAAQTIEAAIHVNDDVSDLIDAEKDALLVTLLDPPDGLLELRSLLASDRVRRLGLR